MKKYIKTLALVLLPLTLALSFASSADAYVSVHGYTRSNGTYVRPYVRSNPNGLKYDNYGWKPSQGLYNPTYGTRGTTWDTPTSITDPNYYLGKQLYEQGSSGYTSPSFTLPQQPPTVSVPANAHPSSFGSSWLCDSGYTKNYLTSQCDRVNVPLNGHLDYFGSGWLCNTGYTKNYLSNQCDRVIIPSNAHLDYFGSGWTCDSGYSKNYLTNQCDRVIVPANTSLNFWGSGWTCNTGYSRNYLTNQCDRLR